MDQPKNLIEQAEAVCYAFYRYEITKGLQALDSFSSLLSTFLQENDLEEEMLQEVNQLLQMILLAVEKRDFLIAADLLRYELLGRIESCSQSAVKRSF